jgi:hypothetical protein
MGRKADALPKTAETSRYHACAVADLALQCFHCIVDISQNVRASISPFPGTHSVPGFVRAPDMARFKEVQILSGPR